MIGYHTPETKHELLRLEYSQFDSFQWQIIPIVCFTGRWLAAVFTDYGDSFDPNLFNVYAVIKNVNEAV
jgi:hypothetical protein